MSRSKLGGAALVTGASSGIGAEYARQLALRGHDLVLVARDTARLDETAKRLAGAHGVRVDVLTADLTSPPDLAKVEARLAEDVNIDLLVNNAGNVLGGDFVDQQRPDIDRLLAVHVTAVAHLTRAALPGFIARGRGGVINIGSVVALLPENKAPLYGAAKSFTLQFTQGLAHQLASTGVQLQVVLPGLTRTEIFERSGDDISALDPEMVMDADDLVEAALAGFDQGELITFPSMRDPALWQGYEAARLALRPGMSRRFPSERYRAKAGAEA